MDDLGVEFLDITQSCQQTFLNNCKVTVVKTNQYVCFSLVLIVLLDQTIKFDMLIG